MQFFLDNQLHVTFFIALNMLTKNCTYSCNGRLSFITSRWVCHICSHEDHRIGEDSRSERGSGQKVSHFHFALGSIWLVDAIDFN